MSVFEQVRELLRDGLSLGDRADELNPSSRLLGEIRELDSSAVVPLLLSIEARFDINVNDDDISQDTFETMESLVGFIEAKRADSSI